MQKLVSGADSAVGASIAAGTAVQASVCIDHIGSIALGNSTHGASICTSAAADAGRTDLISHKSTSIKICTPIVTQEIQKASIIYREKFHFGKRKQINTPVHRLFSKKSRKVKDYLLTLWVSVLYYNQGQRKSKPRWEEANMGISDLIAGFIQDALDEANGVLELQRSDLAQRFGCVPSQINYVMSTRFSPEHGYIVESRRGGGGYIRIRRVQMDRQTLLMHVINSIGGELDGRSARAILTNLAQSEAVAPAAAQTALCALSDSALRTVPKDRRDALRADILKQILIHLV
jgi:transcriptional regulator CtsR